jgi:redox-sensitive bicupin YhaK (pirin superfamily)
MIKSKPTLEGAGVHLRRAFGFGNTGDFDPFLLFDDFRNDVPEDYAAGFPRSPRLIISKASWRGKRCDS